MNKISITILPLTALPMPNFVFSEDNLYPSGDNILNTYELSSFCFNITDTTTLQIVVAAASDTISFASVIDLVSTD